MDFERDVPVLSLRLLVRELSCLAVMPRYLLAREPAVMFASARADASADDFDAVRDWERDAERGGGLGRPSDGVDLPEGVALPDGVALPEMDGVIRPESRTELRFDMTDAGRAEPGPVVGDDSFEYWRKIPHSGGHVK
jgi:hypothetical protein